MLLAKIIGQNCPAYDMCSTMGISSHLGRFAKIWLQKNNPTFSTYNPLSP